MRLEKEAEKRDISSNRLVFEFAMEDIERRKWSRTGAEIHLLQSPIFAAQAILRDMVRAGREEEIEQIRRNITAVSPELPKEQC